MGPKGDRRTFLTLSLAATASLAAPKIVHAHTGERKISFHNIHTGESLDTVYWAEGSYVTEGLGEVDRVLRDFRSGEVQAIDLKLIDLLHRLHERLGGNQAFRVISGYRSPATNAMLRKQSSGVAKRSYHMRGMAIDVSLPGVELARLRKAALSLKGGGVGYYPKPGFVHLDTGRVRRW
jgi:uncharacterized protein YcbK (DUF882 family)